MWYVRGRIRGIGLFAVALGVIALLAGDFGTITWAFILGGVVLWVLGGTVFSDTPKKGPAEEYRAQAEKRWSPDRDHSSKQSSVPPVGSSQSSSGLGAEELMEDSASADDPTISQDPEVNAEVASDVRNLADAIADDLEDEWKASHPDGDEFKEIPYARIREVSAKATSGDQRFDAGDKALLSMLVSGKLRSRGYRVG